MGYFQLFDCDTYSVLICWPVGLIMRTFTRRLYQPANRLTIQLPLIGTKWGDRLIEIQLSNLSSNHHTRHFVHICNTIAQTSSEKSKPVFRVKHANRKKRKEDLTFPTFSPRHIMEGGVHRLVSVEVMARLFFMYAMNP